MKVPLFVSYVAAKKAHSLKNCSFIKGQKNSQTETSMLNGVFCMTAVSGEECRLGCSYFAFK